MPSSPGILRSVTTRSGLEVLELGQGLEAVGRGLHGVALVAKELGQRGAGVGFVIDDQDSSQTRHMGLS